MSLSYSPLFTTEQSAFLTYLENLLDVVRFGETIVDSVIEVEQ
jgi:hypothetical protein